jgi:integrase
MRSFPTKLEAEAWLAGERIGAPREAAGLAAVAPVEAGMVTFADYSAQWIAQGGRTGSLAPRTAAEYGRLRSRFLLPTFGRLPLAEITPAQVRTWYGRLGEQTGPTARKQAYSLLASIMITAAEDDLIAASPCRVRGVYKPSRARVTVLTPGDYAALLEATPERFRAMIALATLCGLRQGEVCELRRRDVDLKRQTVTISRAVTRVPGAQVVGTPKTDAGRRVLVMPPSVLPLVEAQLEQWAQPGPDGLLFPSSAGKQLRPSSLYKWFYAARESIGRESLRFHDLRHTGATLYAGGGTTTADQLAWLGHTTPTMALRYQHAADIKRQREVAARAFEGWGASPTPEGVD